MVPRAELIELSGKAAWQANDEAKLPSGSVRAIVAALDALRLAVLATLEPDVTIEDDTKIDAGRYCRVELFGHNVRYGLVREVEYAGRRWLEVEEPEIVDPGQDTAAGAEPKPQQTFPERRKRYHPNAVYAIEEVGEDAVMETLRRLRGFSLPGTDEPPDDDEDLF